MPNLNAPTGPNRYSGWYRDQLNNVLEAYYLGTLVMRHSTSATTFPLATTFSSTLASGAITATGAVTANTTGFVSTGGNIKLASAGVFASTQPVGALVMGGTTLTGIAPVGSIPTAAGVFASDTVVRKIIADGTASNVET